MSRLFITQKERKLISDVTKELVQTVVGERIIYFGISLEDTQVNHLYLEATKKVYLPPVKIYALVNWEGPRQTSTDFQLDRLHRIEVYFHNDELKDRNMQINTGDFLVYGNVVYEIKESGEEDLLFGQVNHKIMTKCICQTARKGAFDPKFVRPEIVEGMGRVSGSI